QDTRPPLLPSTTLFRSRTVLRERRLHAGANVLCAAHDLQRLVAVGHAAHVQFLGVRMTLDGRDFADDDAGKIGSRAMHALDLQRSEEHTSELQSRENLV